MALFCAGKFKIYHDINRPLDNTVATELFFVRWKFVEKTDCSVNLKYKSNSLTKHTANKT